MKQPKLIPRIICGCGWYNNKPSKRGEPYARCKKCGQLINARERFKEKVRLARTKLVLERRLK